MQESKLPKRQYTDEFKTEAIRLGESVGGHEAARRLGIPVAIEKIKAAEAKPFSAASGHRCHVACRLCWSDDPGLLLDMKPT